MGRIISRKEAAEMLGCDPQTVSNWLDAGIISGKKKGRNRMTLIDEDSILALSDSLQDLAETEERVKNRLEEQKKLDLQLEKYVQDMRHALRLSLFIGADNIRADFFRTVTDAALDSGLIKIREHDIICHLIDNSPIDSVAQWYGLTRSRILQILGKGIAKIAQLGNYGELVRENEKLELRLAAADEVIRNKDTELSELRKQLNIQGQEGETEPQEIIEMRNLLNTRLVDLNLSVRTLNCLVHDWRTRKWKEIDTLGDLVQLSRTDLLKIRNFGKKSLGEVADLLENLNLDFGMDIDRYMKKGAELQYKGYETDR